MRPTRDLTIFRVKARMLANAPARAIDAYDELAPAVSAFTSWGDISTLLDRFAERPLSIEELFAYWDRSEPDSPYVTLIDGIRARVAEQRAKDVYPTFAALKALTDALAKDPSEFEGA